MDIQTILALPEFNKGHALAIRNWIRSKVDTAERRRRYHLYLKSTHWQQLRISIIGQANGTCEVCCESPATEVHHRTYQNVGAELMTDLVAVCRGCHEKVTLQVIQLSRAYCSHIFARRGYKSYINPTPQKPRLVKNKRRTAKPRNDGWSFRPRDVKLGRARVVWTRPDEPIIEV